MILIFLILACFLLLLLAPKGTNLHEIIRLPYYNYKAQTAKRNEMIMYKYQFGAHRRQYLYLFLPKGKKVSKEEVIIYFHGGGWTFGNPMMFRCNAQLFVDLGYAVIMPTYRRLPFFNADDMQEDIRLALKTTIDIIKEKSWQNKRLIIAGLSSGAHLAALLCYNKTHFKSLELPREKLAGILLLGPPLDLREMTPTPVIWKLVGRRKQALFQRNNPVNYLEPTDQQATFLLHGTKDGLVNYNSSLSFIKKRGTEAFTFYTIENGTHLDAGFWIFEEGEIRDAIFNWLESLEIKK